MNQKFAQKMFTIMYRVPHSNLVMKTTVQFNDNPSQRNDVSV